MTEQTLKETFEQFWQSLKEIDDDQKRIDFFMESSTFDKFRRADRKFFKLNQIERQRIVDSVMVYGYLEVMVQIAQWLEGPDGRACKNWRHIQCIFYNHLASITDSSQKAVYVLVAVPDFVELTVRNITDPETIKEIDQNLVVSIFVSVNLCIIHNMAKFPETQEKFRSCKTVEAVEPLFDVKSEKIQISALSSAACILDESEVAKMCVDKRNIASKLVNCLGEALKVVDGPHSYMGFTAEELVESLNFLAVNDCIKKNVLFQLQFENLKIKICV